MSASDGAHPSPPPRPRPRPTRDTKSFWEATARGVLLLQECRACSAYVFYPRLVCPSCGAMDLCEVPSQGRGSVYSFTIARRPTHPAFAARVPYVIAIVELAEGPRLTTNIVECSPGDVRIGMDVELVFDESSDGIALPLFRPVV